MNTKQLAVVKKVVSEVSSLEKKIQAIVGEAVGGGSLCWTPRPGNQVFNSEEASKIVDEASDKICHLISDFINSMSEVESEYKS